MKMRITHISDTHNKHKKLNGKLPGGDLLIHSGDISSLGREHEVKDFIKWFNGIDNYMYKIFIAGNHDMSFDKEVLLRNKLDYFDGGRNNWDTKCADGKPQWLIDILELGLGTNVFYLENSFVELDGIKIWGSPYSPTFGYNWAFNADRGEVISKIWNEIPNDTDIVITHGPIYGYRDKTYRTYENVGCADLLHRLHAVKPHLHFSGHIHEDYGYAPIQYGDWSGYAFNGCICTLSYEPNNNPITFDYDFVNRELEFIDNEK
jgi:Icc-related predicted phosphoesterase